MSRRSRAGTAEKPPSVEETVGRLEVKLKELELKYELREKEETNYRNSVAETLETLRDLQKSCNCKTFILGLSKFDKKSWINWIFHNPIKHINETCDIM